MVTRIATVPLLLLGMVLAGGCDGAKSPVLKEGSKAGQASQPTKEAKEAQFKLGGPKPP